MVARATRINNNIKVDLEAESTVVRPKKYPKPSPEAVAPSPPVKEPIDLQSVISLLPNVVACKQITKDNIEALLDPSKKCFLVITNEVIEQQKETEPEFKFEIKKDEVPSNDLKEQIAQRMKQILQK